MFKSRKDRVRNQMIDFHTHVLPYIDDGSRSIEETELMLREERKQGSRVVIATPHFYGDRVAIDDFLEARRRAFLQVRDAIYANQEDRNGEETLPGMLTGAEVFFFPGMGRAEKLPLLTIGRTETILIEMPFEQWGVEEVHGILDILSGQHLNIVLAHVERYPQFQKDHSAWEEIMAMPLVKQVNAGSLLHGRARRKFVLNLLKKDENVVLGSDCHNADSRPVNLAEARKVIVKKLGERRLQSMDQLAMQILKERD